jgi:hypothetical protein
MDIQHVLMLCNNFKPFVFQCLGKVHKFQNLLRTMQKKTYKDCNILLMCITRDNLFKTRISRFTWCVT